MSIVEKAAERLKALQPESSAPAQEEATVSATTPAEHGSTIERLQERERLQARTQTADPAAPAASPWRIDLEMLERHGLLPGDEDAHARLADELRRIKRPLLSNAIGRGAKLLANPERIVVTSASPGEGKTFTTMNLALSLARERDFEVLLVDGDIPKFDITRSLGLEGQPGLMDALTDEQCNPADVILQTDIPNLMVVPAGKPDPLTSELFGSLRMQRVLDGLGGRDKRRLLLFDSSPLLATSESQVLAGQMGQVVMVVASGTTRQHILKSALECLSDTQYIGMVLNMSRLPASENSYDSYYGKYGRYGERNA